MFFNQLNWVDYTIFALILLSIIWCYRRGFVGSTFTLICWIAAIAGSFKLAKPVGNVFENAIKSDQIRTILGFFIIFIILALVGVLLIYLFNHLIEKATLQKTDKMIGAFSGIVVGIFLIAGILLVARYSTLPTRPFWGKSFFIPYFQVFEDVINDILPATIQAHRDILPDVTPKKMSDEFEKDVKDVKKDVEEAFEDISDDVKKKSQDAGNAVKKSAEKIVDTGEE